jgi:hypothetical protein
MHTHVYTEGNAWVLWISENPSRHYLTKSGTQCDPLVEGMYQMHFMAEKPKLRTSGPLELKQ